MNLMTRVVFIILGTTFASLANASVYDYQMENLKGDLFKFSELKGKVVLIVNTASKCGYTPQYKSLGDLYKKYKSKGLEIVAVPSGDFADQEFDDAKKIKSFCDSKYQVQFPLMKKSHVTGKNKIDIYGYLTSALENKAEVAWNFEKFLVNKNGKVVSRYKSAVDPMDSELVSKLESLIKK